MKSRTKTIAASVLAVMLIIAAVGAHGLGSPAALPEGTGQIHLYGEYHGVEICFEKELELWSSYYHDNGMRHLFLEEPYYVAEYLNLWMQTGDEEILGVVSQRWIGHDAYNQSFMDFYRRIREECPETVFHGTDVGQAYQSMGARFLEYLESIGQTDTEQYRLAQACVEQGQYYKEHDDDGVYRENKMAENFIRERESLGIADIMAICGGAHTDVGAMDPVTGTVPSLGSQLYEQYGDKLHSVQLAGLVEPIREETITIGGKEYTAQYYGKNFYPVLEEIQYWELWRLKGVFDEFSYNTLTFDNHGYDYYFIKVERGDILIRAYTYTDGHVERYYYRANNLRDRSGFCVEGFLAE